MARTESSSTRAPAGTSPMARFAAELAVLWAAGLGVTLPCQSAEPALTVHAAFAAEPQRQAAAAIAWWCADYLAHRPEWPRDLGWKGAFSLVWSRGRPRRRPAGCRRGRRRLVLVRPRTRPVVDLCMRRDRGLVRAAGFRSPVRLAAPARCARCGPDRRAAQSRPARGVRAPGRRGCRR